MWHLDKITCCTSGVLPPSTQVCDCVRKCFPNIYRHTCVCACMCVCVLKTGLAVCLPAIGTCSDLVAHTCCSWHLAENCSCLDVCNENIYVSEPNCVIAAIISMHWWKCCVCCILISFLLPWKTSSSKRAWRRATPGGFEPKVEIHKTTHNVCSTGQKCT